MSALFIMSACCIAEAVRQALSPKEKGPTVYRKPD